MAEPQKRSGDASPEHRPAPAPLTPAIGPLPAVAPVAPASGLYLIASNREDPRAALERLDTGTRYDVVRSMQRIHGNATAQRLLDRRPRPVGVVPLRRRKTETESGEAKPPAPSSVKTSAATTAPSPTNGATPAIGQAKPTGADGAAPTAPGLVPASNGSNGAYPPHQIDQPGASEPKVEAAATKAGSAPVGGAKGDGKTPTSGSKEGEEAGEGAGAAGGAPAASVDTSSAEGLLASIASAPVSGLAQVLGLAKAALPAIQGREKNEAQAAIPAIDQPTGLPAVAAPKEATGTQLPQKQAADPKLATGRAKELAEPKAPEPTGPLPASKVSTTATEPAAGDQDDGGGSWWSWLFDRLKSFFGSLPTTDPNVSTSAGPRQRVDLSGEANPAQNDGQQRSAEQDVAGHRAEADAATKADFGEDDVYPSVPTSKLRPSYKPGPPQGTGGPPALEAVELPAKEQGEFDRATAPWLHEHVKEQQDSYRKEKTVYERATKEAQETGKRQLDEETLRTRTEQEGMRKQVRADVTAERTRWQEENRKIQESVGTKASAKRSEIDKQIQEKVKTTHDDADRQLQEAETKAEAEKGKADAEAAAKKREEENKPRSWWDRVKGAVSSAFDAIRSAVNAIFDKLRQLVKGIIEAARRAVHTLIEAARAAIVGMIKAFGEFVKGLVSLALAAFPEAAAKARAWIDGKVKAATDAVNRAAEALHKAADAILDGIAKAIDAALGILQAAFNKALDILEKLALLPFQAMEALTKLVAWVAKNGKFVMGALNMEGGSDKVIDGLKKAIGGMIAEVPAKAHAKLQEFAGSLGDVKMSSAAAAPAATSAKAAPSPPVQRQAVATAVPAAPAKRHVSAAQHLQGILRHLDKGLEHLKAHWWDELKKVGWNLLWPWPAVWQDLKDIWKEVKAGFDDAYHLRVGKVIDRVLTITQKFNSIVGNLYGWFFIASVLIGAIIGAFFGGAGAIPGALAGAAFAGEVGEALVVALIATETAVIVKSVADLAIGNDTKAEDEEDYSKIGGSTLTIAVTAALMLLGEIAADLAKSIWEGVSGLFRGEKGPEVKIDVKVGEGEGAAGEAKGGEVKADDGSLGTEGGKRVLAEEPTSEGTIKVEEDGTCVICRTCVTFKEQMHADFPNELADPANAKIKADLDAAEGIADAAAKAKAEAEILERLLQARDQAARRPALELDPQTKATNPKSKLEADAILQCEREGLVKGARRPDLAKGEPNLDFVIDGGYADIKTPDTAFRSVTKNVNDIASKIPLYDANVKVVIDLVKLNPAQKAQFLSELAAKGVDMSRVIIINK